jgi:hypothetical protein
MIRPPGLVRLSRTETPGTARRGQKRPLRRALPDIDSGVIGAKKQKIGMRRQTAAHDLPYLTFPKAGASAKAMGSSL